MTTLRLGVSQSVAQGSAPEADPITVPLDEYLAEAMGEYKDSDPF